MNKGAVVANYATTASDGRNVCIFGRSGAGKSYCLVSIGQELCPQGFSCLMVDYMTFTAELATLRTKDSEQYKKKLRKYARVPFLLVDDFLSENETPEVVSTLFQLLKLREEGERKPTIIATQYDPQEWCQLLAGESLRQGEADSIRRRLVDNSYLTTINIQTD